MLLLVALQLPELAAEAGSYSQHSSHGLFSNGTKSKLLNPGVGPNLEKQRAVAWGIEVQSGLSRVYARHQHLVSTHITLTP